MKKLGKRLILIKLLRILAMSEKTGSRDVITYNLPFPAHIRKEEESVNRPITEEETAKIKELIESSLELEASLEEGLKLGIDDPWIKGSIEYSLADTKQFIERCRMILEIGEVSVGFKLG